MISKTSNTPPVSAVTPERRTRLSWTVSLYIARQLLLAFLIVFGLFITVILLIDFIELLRRASGKSDVGISTVLTMAVYKLPLTAQKTLPFAVLFSCMLAFWRLNRSSELIALRAAGVSVWHFLLPAIIAAIALGAFKVTIVNPLGTALIARYENLEAIHLARKTSLMATSSGGVWLRQRNDKNLSVLHTASRPTVTASRLELPQVIVFIYKNQDEFVARLDAKLAVLERGFWRLEDGTRHERGKPATPFKVKRIPTDLTLGKIQESFSSPSTISFWELPTFIRALEAIGFSTLGHRLHLHSLLAEPMLYCAMIFIAAVFSLRHNRRAGILLAVAGGVGTGLILFFVSDLVLALAHSTGVPPFLAAWAPAVASAFLGVTILLHVEDG